VPTIVAARPAHVAPPPTGAVTVVVSVSLSLLATGSVSPVPTATSEVFVSVPALVGRTWIVTVADGVYSVTAIAPSSHVTVLPLRSHVPCDAVALTKSVWLGSLSVTVTALAAPGPRLVTEMLYVSTWPS